MPIVHCVLIVGNIGTWTFIVTVRPAYEPNTRENDHAARDDRSVIHVSLRDRQFCGNTEDDADKQRPTDTRQVCRPTNESITHVEWAWFKVHFRVVSVQASQEDRDNVRQVEGYGTKGEDGISSDRAREIKQSWKNAQYRSKPYGAQRSCRP